LGVLDGAKTMEIVKNAKLPKSQKPKRGRGTIGSIS